MYTLISDISLTDIRTFQKFLKLFNGEVKLPYIFLSQKTTYLFHKWIDKVLNFKEVHLLTLSYSAKYNKNSGLLLHIKTSLTGSEYKRLWLQKFLIHWIDIMSRELQPPLSWLDHELVRETLLDYLKLKYTRTKCSMDCSEVVIQRPISLSASTEMHSSHNTINFVVAINRTDAIIYVYKSWGGCVSE